MLLAQLAHAESTSALARLVEPWNSLYSDSKAVATTVMFFHLVPLLIAGGAALTADRATIRASRASAEDRTRQLGEGCHLLSEAGIDIAGPWRRG